MRLEEEHRRAPQTSDLCGPSPCVVAAHSSTVKWTCLSLKLYKMYSRKAHVIFLFLEEESHENCTCTCMHMHMYMHLPWRLGRGHLAEPSQTVTTRVTQLTSEHIRLEGLQKPLSRDRRKGLKPSASRGAFPRPPFYSGRPDQLQARNRQQPLARVKQH